MEVTIIKIPGSQALAELERRRQAFPTTGEYPFLIGDDDGLDQLRESAEFIEETPEAIIQSSLHLDLQAWIEEQRGYAKEYELTPEGILGEWPGEEHEKEWISLHLDFSTGAVLPEVNLGIARIKEPWQLPAVMEFGDFNYCPFPDVHCAFHRTWQADYGAQICGMSGDTIECIVNNPPLDRETALELAWQQYWYCSDIVHQGCETINNLAAALLNAPYWFFWWD